MRGNNLQKNILSVHLEPCPFCGGKVIIGRGIDGEITGILCRTCKVRVKWDIQMKAHETFGENEAKWADRWNRRVSDVKEH